ncbi:uncharacterized protein LOC117293993 [Asterias rubens]|uniref:uncharacterized protein LOC117293993 n=1 Tax=Asterias rubens TaxID=7604 RepID=UPI001455CBA3|nr:uncharacterized protein LOC117293993 [Asterias rubens]
MQSSNEGNQDVIKDYYNRLPGPCGECCLKFPCPSILACLAMLVGDALLLAGFHLGAEETQVLFTGTPVSKDFNIWFTNVQVVIYCLSVLMAFLAILLLAISCLGTGATRSVYICRFKTRSSGRWQTGLFMVASYFLFLCWLTATCFAVVPVFFMFVMNHGVCMGVDLEQQTCLSLVQWGFLVPNEDSVGNNKEFVCDEQMRKICNSNLMFFFSMAFLGCLLMVLASVQFTINMSANFAQLLDRYKRAYMTGNAGSYNMRTGVQEFMRGSKRGTGNSRRPYAGGASNAALVRTAGNGLYDGADKYADVEPEPYGSAVEMASMSRQEVPPPLPPPYVSSTREPLSNLQHRARSYDPLNYDEYSNRLQLQRGKGFSRSAEPIDFSHRYDRYDEYDI